MEKSDDTFYEYTCKMFAYYILRSNVGCASLNGSIDRSGGNDSWPYFGRYYSKDKELSVDVPALLPPSTTDYAAFNLNAVRFSSGDGYWMMDGEYHIDQIKMKPQRGAEKNLPIAMKAILQNEKQNHLKIQMRSNLG